MDFYENAKNKYLGHGHHANKIWYRLAQKNIFDPPKYELRGYKLPVRYVCANFLFADPPKSTPYMPLQQKNIVGKSCSSGQLMD